MGRALELRTFNAGDGDCLLLSAFEDTENRSDTGFHMLIDGGRKGTFTKFTAPYLYGNEEISQLDLVVVSHIDNDHISGVLRLTKDSSLRAIYEEHYRDCGQAGCPNEPCYERRCRRRPPKEVPVPPDAPHIEFLWHNRVVDLAVGATPSEQGHSLAVAASMVSGTLNLGGLTAEAMRYAASIENLATGHASAVEIEYRVDQRGIPTNDEILTVGELLRQNHPGGPLAITVIGPTQDRLVRVHRDWEKWKCENQERINKIKRAVDDEKKGVDVGLNVGAVRPDGLALGGGKHISAPNLASLMLLVSWPADDDSGPDPSTSILLTGDGSSEDILDGLVATGNLCGSSSTDTCVLGHDDCPADDTMHIAVMKVPHHGADANVTQALCEHVIADHYIFCGNGNHTNPELAVLERIFDARRCVSDVPFTFWFSSSQHCPDLNTDRVAHMQEVEKRMLDYQSKDPNFSFTMMAPHAKCSSSPHLKNDALTGQGQHLLWSASNC